MKILFFFALLINIIFFLWEINAVDLNSPIPKVNNDKVKKQILLVSELSKKNKESSVSSVEKEKEQIVQFNFSEADPESILDSEPILNNSQTQAVEGLSISEELAVNGEIVEAVSEKNEVEQRTLLQMIKKTEVINKTESDEENPPLKQNILAEAGGEDEENELTQVKSFWTDFSFIFDKENNYSSQINDQPDANEFSKANSNKSTGSSSLTDTLKNWSVSIFGQPINNEDGNGINPKKNNELQETQQQIIKKYCHEVGPFATHQAIEDWRKSNKINTTSLEIFKINNKILSSYLVYHPAENTFKQSKIIANAYKKKGISEVWLFRKGGLRGAISFGLFKDEKRALRLQKKLIKNGLYAELLERYKTQPVHYARISTIDETFIDTIIISDKQKINKCNKAAVQEK